MEVELAWVTGIAAKSCSASAKLKEQRHLCGLWDNAASQGHSRGGEAEGTHLLSEGPWEMEYFLGKTCPSPTNPIMSEGCHG